MLNMGLGKKQRFAPDVGTTDDSSGTGSISPQPFLAPAGYSRSAEQDMAFTQIRTDLIGRLDPVNTPFGLKPLVYADWTASGRPVASIENFMRYEVLPRYGNTHTTSSETGAQTTIFREEAREIIAEAVNAKGGKKADADVVLFVGSGTTAAVAKIVSALSLDKQPRSGKKSGNNTPVVFVGPFEHHSNLLPWRESCADVVQIRENEAGGLDVDDLEQKLKAFSRRRLKIGSFAAASNLTGAMEDTDRITRVLHRGGALSFWDYATAAPYVEIDMNPAGLGEFDEALVAKDAIFISGHKFLGGAGTPGLLVCKQRLFTNKAPVMPGGGTVLLVSKGDHTYLSNIEEREEGGTPDILGSIRLGLVFQMKERLGCVEDREEELAHLGLSTFRSNPRIALLGDTGRKRLPIFSFVIRHGDRFLHHNFVCALLNDLFGIQARAGCQCAGPYAIRLLGIANSLLPGVKKQIVDGIDIVKPGFCRLSLAFFLSDAEVNYILDAVMFVADHGAAFLPLYQPDLVTSEWKYSALPLQQVDATSAESKHNEQPVLPPRPVTRKRLSQHNDFFAEGCHTPAEEEEKESVDLQEETDRVNVRSMDEEASLFKRHMADAFDLASNVSSMRSSSASKILGDKEGVSPQENALPYNTIKLSERFSRVNVGVSHGTTRAPKLHREAERLRWFYFPSERTLPHVNSRGNRSKPAPALIEPKTYRNAQRGTYKKGAPRQHRLDAHQEEESWRDGEQRGFSLHEVVVRQQGTETRRNSETLDQRMWIKVPVGGTFSMTAANDFEVYAT